MDEQNSEQFFTILPGDPVKFVPYRQEGLIFYKLDSRVELPKYATEGSSCMDLRAFIPDKKKLWVLPGETVAIPTGLIMDIMEGYEVQIRPRSGLGLKHSTGAFFGTVDWDFVDEVKVIFHNFSKNDFHITHGDRIAQMAFCPVCKPIVGETMDRPKQKTSRVAGFGHTGVG